jgi:hypothetical protein
MLAYEPTMPELRGIHAGYVAAWRSLETAYREISLGLEAHDQLTLARGRQGLLEWRRAVRGTANDIVALVEVLEARARTGPPI